MHRLKASPVPHTPHEYKMSPYGHRKKSPGLKKIISAVFDIEFDNHLVGKFVLKPMEMLFSDMLPYKEKKSHDV